MPVTLGLFQVCTVSKFANAAKCVMGGWFMKEMNDSLVFVTTIFLFENSTQFLYKCLFAFKFSSTKVLLFVDKKIFSFLLFK